MQNLDPEHIFSTMPEDMRKEWSRQADLCLKAGELLLKNNGHPSDEDIAQAKEIMKGMEKNPE